MSVRPIYFISGASSLIAEVVLVRLLKLTLGNTVYASSIVVSVFLGGLALGAMLAARRADRARSPLRVYALLEFGVALLLVLMPLLLGGADRFYRFYFAAVHPSQSALLPVQVLVSAFLLLLPTTLMGATLPVLANLVARGGADGTPGVSAGRSVGGLYAVNTFGAACGCFLAGFVLIGRIGVTATLYVAAALGCGAAVWAWRLAAGSRAGFTPAMAGINPALRGTVAGINPALRGDMAGINPALRGTVDGINPALRGAGGINPALRGATGAQPVRRGRIALLLVSFLAGFVSIGYEILWIRGFINFLVATTYVFSAVLTVYLAGTMAGAWLASRLAGALRSCLPALGGALVLLGAVGLALVPTFAAWPTVHDFLANPVTGFLADVAGLPDEVVYPVAMALGFFLIPAVAIGLSFPLVLGAWRSDAGTVGESTGRIYGASTLGSVVGGLVTGFVFIPFLGVQTAALALGVTAALAGQAVLVACRGWWRTVAALALAATAVAAIGMPRGLFTQLIVNRLGEQYRAAEVLYVREGVTTVVAVHTETETLWTVPLSGTTLVQRVVRTQEPTRHITVSGMHIASDEPGQSAWQKFHGHSAMLLGACRALTSLDPTALRRAGFTPAMAGINPALRGTVAGIDPALRGTVAGIDPALREADKARVLCVGYGSGESVACVSRHDPAALDCVEISPEVAEAAARFFPHINLGAERDRKVRMIYADGKNYLHLTDARYDVITCDPINPVFGDNGSLYARDFFRSAHERLEPGGLFLFWLPLHLPKDVLETILATALDVYPHVTFWTIPISGGTFIQVVCSGAEQRYSPASLDRRLMDPRVKADMAKIGIVNSADFLAYYRGDEIDLAKALSSRRINSDDHPVVEFSTQRAMFKDTAPMILKLLQSNRPDGLFDHLDWQGIPEQGQPLWVQRYRATRAAIVP